MLLFLTETFSFDSRPLAWLAFIHASVHDALRALTLMANLARLETWVAQEGGIAWAT
jgi:hypothetical protein